MSELDEYDIQINSELDQIQKDTDNLSKKDANQKKNAIKKIQNQLKGVLTLIQTYELEISSLDKPQADQYAQSFKQTQNKYQRVKQEFEFKKSEDMSGGLYDGRNQQPTDIKNMNQQQVIELGDKKQSEGSDAIMHIQQLVEEGNQLATEINAELDKQIEQLDRMYGTVKDTQTTLKRTKKHLKYFARNLYTDKIIICLMGLIFITITVLIILSATGNDGGKLNVPDEVRSENQRFLSILERGFKSNQKN